MLTLFSQVIQGEITTESQIFQTQIKDLLTPKISLKIQISQDLTSMDCQLLHIFKKKKTIL